MFNSIVRKKSIPKNVKANNGYIIATDSIKHTEHSNQIIVKNIDSKYFIVLPFVVVNLLCLYYTLSANIVNRV